MTTQTGALSFPWKIVYFVAAASSAAMLGYLCWELATTGDISLPVRAAPERISTASTLNMLIFFGTSAATAIHALVRSFRAEAL